MTAIRIGQIWLCRDQRIRAHIDTAPDGDGTFIVTISVTHGATADKGVWSYTTSAGQLGREGYPPLIPSPGYWYGLQSQYDLAQLLYDPQETGTT